MARQRPAAILVIAILHIIGGSLGMLGSCYQVAILGAALASGPTPPRPTTKVVAPPGRPTTPTPPSSAELMNYYKENVPGYNLFQYGSLAMNFLLDVMLLAGGIGLLKMQPWARVLSLVYAPISIVVHIITFVYSLVYVVPATHDLFAKIGSLGPMGSIMDAAILLGLFVNLLVTIYPIVVLVLLLRSSTAAAFRDDVPSREIDEPFGDDPWREPRSDAFTR